MKVIYKKANGKPEILDINNDYKELQKLVGGYFDHLYLSKNVGVYLHDEGKLLNLDKNVVLYDEDLNILDILVGDIVIVQHSRENDISLSDKNIEKYVKMLNDECLIVD